MSDRELKSARALLSLERSVTGSRESALSHAETKPLRAGGIQKRRTILHSTGDTLCCAFSEQIYSVRGEHLAYIGPYVQLMGTAGSKKQ